MDSRTMMMTRRIKCVAIAKGLAFSTERVYNTSII